MLFVFYSSEVLIPACYICVACLIPFYYLDFYYLADASLCSNVIFSAGEKISMSEAPKKKVSKNIHIRSVKI